ncbi:MAG TPA: cytochrome c oxidase subunit II [Thermoleophilia bacterium]|nr:cytochrome c oxidase subunit II [Thermoleophilia bacterium]
MTRNASSFRHARRVIVLRAGFLAVLAVGLAGCASQSPSVFRTGGASAHDIAVLTYTMFGILSAVLITVWSLLAWVLIRYRERPGREASKTHGNTTIEVVWTAIPAIIVAVLFTLTLQTTGKLVDPGRPVQFTVTGHQWWWQVRYAGADFETANEIHMPAYQTVSLDVLSADVIHGFWVPQLAGKIQLIPSHVNHLTILPVVPGTYLGVCANFCGKQHAHMHFLMIVQPAAQFSSWFRNQMRPAVTPTGTQAVAGAAAIAALPCASCHTIRGTSLHGTYGPDLTHLASRSSIAAVTLTNTPANLTRWIADPQAVKPGTLMPVVPVTPQTVAEIVAYLDELK